MRKGNRYVRRLLCEMANAARRSECAFKGKYARQDGGLLHVRVESVLGFLTRPAFTLRHYFSPERLNKFRIRFMI